MHRIDAAGHADHLFSNGNPQTGTLATVVDADWLNAAQEELAAAIEGAGIDLTKGTNNQLLAAIPRLVSRSWQPFGWKAGDAPPDQAGDEWAFPADAAGELLSKIDNPEGQAVGAKVKLLVAPEGTGGGTTVFRLYARDASPGQIPGAWALASTLTVNLPGTAGQAVAGEFPEAVDLTGVTLLEIKLDRDHAGDGDEVARLVRSYGKEVGLA